VSVLKDAFSASAEGTTDLSWTHTPVGSPKGVCVLVVMPISATDQVASVTYGGVALTEIALSPLLKAAAEAGGVHGFFLGLGIPTGPQTVLVTVSGAATKRAGCYTVTADTSRTSVVDTTTISSDSLLNPSGTLSLGGIECFCCEVFMSGQNNVLTGCAPLTNWTGDLEWDPGNAGGCWYSYNIIGTSDVTMGYTSTAEDCILLAVAIRQNAAERSLLWNSQRQSMQPSLVR